MKPILITILLFVIAAIPIATIAQVDPAKPVINTSSTKPGLQATAARWMNNNRTGFVENKGQFRDQHGNSNATVKYMLNLPGLKVQLRGNAFSYDTWVADKKPGSSSSATRKDALSAPVDEAPPEVTVKFHRVDVELEGANPSPEIVAENILPGADHIMDGPIEIRDIRSYSTVTYRDIYPGIDLEFVARKGTDKPVEYNFIVHPGADPAQIKIHYKGADHIALSEGKIKMTLIHGILTEQIPASFIEQTGENVAVQYKASGNLDGLYAFHVPDYDRSKTLIIDPTPTLMWATYLGGAENTYDDISSVRLDKLGNVIVTGSTDALSGIATLAAIGPTSGTYNTTFAKGFVVKYTSSGVKTWGVTIGGNTSDPAVALAVDNSNNIYVGMYTNSTNLRTIAGVHQTTSGGGNDIYVAKITTNGAYVWGTYIGGAGGESIFGLLVTNDGNILLGGYTTAASANVAFGGGYDMTYGGGVAGTLDGIIVKLNATTGDGMWGAYMGGTDADWVLGIGTDATGNIYYTGAVASAGLATAGAYQTVLGGSYDYIIGRLNSTGSVRNWATYFGGPEDDAGFEIVADHNGDIVVSGRFASPGMATPGTYQPTHGGSHDALVLKMTSTGTLLWATYYGGPGSDQAHALAISEDNGIYIYGHTTSASGIATNCSFQPVYGGATDCYVAKIDATGSTRLWGSYFGGANLDMNNNTTNNAGDNIAYAGNGVFYISGYTESTGLSTGGAADVSLTGTVDGFLAKLSEGFAPADVQVTTQTLSPMTQTACAMGIPSVITGNIVSIYNPATFTSPIFYQWQVADAETGPWTDMPGEVFKDLTPLSGNTTKYYRRNVLVNDGFCDKKIVSTSPVATVNVSSNVAPIANANGPQWFLCGSPNSVILNGSGTTTAPATITTYQWYAGSNLTTPVATTANYTPTNITAATTYTLKVTDNNGCTDVDQVTMTPAVANAGPDKSLCQGSGGVQIGTTGIAGGAVSYSWTLSTGASAAATLSCTSCAQPIATPVAATTTYRLTVTVTRKDGSTCSTIDDVIVSFVASPTNGPALAGPDRTICKTNSILLGNGTADPAATYSWAPANYLSNPNIARPNFNAGIAMVSCPLTYTVTAVKNGCTFTDVVNVSVINPQVDYEGDTTQCYIFSEQLNEPNCTSATYAWQLLSGPGVVQSTTAGGASATLYNPGATLARFQRVTTVNGVSCPSEIITVNPCGSGCPTTQIKVVGDKGCPKVFGDQEFQLYLKGVNPNQWNFSWTPANIMDNPTAAVVTINANTPAIVDVVITNKITGMVCHTDDLPINDPAWIQPTINTPDRNICPNVPTGIGELAGGGYSYEWTPIQGLTNPGLSNPLATLTSTASYYVIKTDNATGCIVTDDVVVNVNEINYDAGNDRTVCNGATVTLGTTPGGNYTYSWSPAGAAYTNGTGPTDANPQVLFAGSSSQEFIVTVTDPVSGCTIMDTVMLSNSVTPGEYAGAAVGPVCPGTTAQLGRDPEPGATYLWSPATGLSCTTCANPFVTTGTTDQTYTLTVTYPGCSTPVTDQITVSVKPVPSVVLNDKTICPSTPTNIGVGGGGGNSASIAGVASYNWSPGTALSCVTCPSPLANPQALTVYTATLTLTNGCIITDEVTVTPTITASAKPDATICPGGSVQLGSPAQAGVTYAWSSVSGSPANTLSCTSCAQPMASPTVTTVYRLTASGSGCTVTDDVQIIVKALPTFNITGNTSICTGGTANLSVTPVAQNTIYQWSPTTGVASPNSPSTAIMPTGTTTYKVTQTDLNSGCSGYKEVIVSVSPNNVSATGGAITVCPSTQDTLPLTVSPLTGNTIVWSPATNLSNPYVQNPVVTPQASGNYIATVTNNTTNCSDTALVIVTVPASCMGADYGDAPLVYDPSVPASHSIVNALKIGTSIDAEGAAASTVLADGDDLNQISNDEEGISFLPGLHTASKTLGLLINSVSNNTGSPAYLVGWIDFNRDGDFDDSGERSSIMAVPSSSVAATQTLQFTGFNTGCVVKAGLSYLRIRLTTDISGGWDTDPSPVGTRTNGEVEDYAIMIEGSDFGDAPAVYPIARAFVNADLDNNGQPDEAGSVWLGNTVDYIGCSGVASVQSDADDLDGTDDEDGLNINGAMGPNETKNWNITVNSLGPVTGVQWGMWIDWNADGAFDAFYNGNVNTSSPVIVPVSVTSPANMVPTYIVRLGVKTGAAFTSADYNYPVMNGEWEDYMGTQITLGVTLVSFTASKADHTALLKWETSAEENSDHFVVQRRSPDALRWEEIGRIAAAGNSTVNRSYSFIDHQPVPGINYYRLKIVDRDGSHQLSPTRLLDFGTGGNHVRIFPNPARSVAALIFEKAQGGIVTVKIHNNVGQLVRTYHFTNPGQTCNLNVLNFAQGIYHVTVTGESINKHMKLMIQ